MRDFLMRLMAIITRHPRYFPKIEWSSKSWTHNFFRVLEIIFGREVGIRQESSVAWEIINGQKIVTYELYTIESLFAYAETVIRECLTSKSFSFKLAPFELVRYQLAVANKEKMIPWITFAIALDVAGGGGGTFSTTSPLTWTHTCTGSDLLLVTSSLRPNNTNSVSTTYNSISMPERVNGNDNNNGYIQLFGLLAPATGANTVSESWPDSAYSYGGSVSYTGVKQSGLPDATATLLNQASAASITGTITTVAANCWVIVLTVCTSTSTASAGTGQTSRATWTGDTGLLLGDSNAALLAGSNSFTTNFAPNATSSIILMSFAPLVTIFPATFIQQTNQPIFIKPKVIPY